MFLKPGLILSINLLVGRSIKKKRGEKPYRSAQLSTLAAFPPWGSSTGAGRMALTSDKSNFIVRKLPTF